MFAIAGADIGAVTSVLAISCLSLPRMELQNGLCCHLNRFDNKQEPEMIVTSLRMPAIVNNSRYVVKKGGQRYAGERSGWECSAER